MSSPSTSTTRNTFDLWKRERRFLTDEHEMFRTSLEKSLEKEAVPNTASWKNIR